MASQTFRVTAEWDADAEVWVATSESVPGLIIEGVTKDEVVEKLRLVIPSLASAGVDREDKIEIFFRAKSTESMTVPLAA